ncbi:hypothetical protein SARC_05911 [Sphaeroforma arctica JP610]|uniref:Uncharacterized protein n=1 Tax=Sphaeroforma arctica JP610 TaxID=667725 RepID=A0A0L0FYT0_9EUKA|nr:hypothetical protein SARC_05911 [Sphaeroforma arctica JP610]KNC81789.1 hypothetical protein SARC_05911 [Sphaeroforma arctica JP610]|eukprot:XP_014155691.1 hypothetical protein SARC_05911 [Sphaeroforma arctica JP610]
MGETDALKLMGVVSKDNKGDARVTSISLLKAQAMHVTVLAPLIENKIVIVNASALIHKAIHATTSGQYLKTLEIAGIYVHKNGGYTDIVEKNKMSTFKQFDDVCTKTLGCASVYFVLDGGVPPAKQQEKQRRREEAETAWQEWLALYKIWHGSSSKALVVSG